MATNEILQFAETDTGTNLLTQAEYAADSQRQIGNQPGVARSKLVNKALRQSSLIAAAVAQFIADNQANNVVDTATPADIADWIEAAVRSIDIPTAVAGGTSDAITADFTPNVALTNGTTVTVRAGAANTTAAPTFAPDGLAAKTIVKGNNLALVAGDIAGAGHWLEMNFDTILDKWVLQNPYCAGIQIASTAEAQAYASDAVALTPLKMQQAMRGSNVSLSTNGYQKLPSGLIIQWGETGSISNNGTLAVTFPISFPSSCYSIVASGTENQIIPNNVAQTAINITNLTRSGFTACNDTSPQSARWIALGY